MRSYTQIPLCLVLAACGGGPAPAQAPTTGGVRNTPSGDDSGGAGAGAAADTPSASFYCRYTNPFSHERECKGYIGSGWTQEGATSDCAAVFTGAMGALSAMPCSTGDAFGTCTTDRGGAKAAVTWYYGGDHTITQSACENFAHGVWGAALGSGSAAPTSGAPMPEALTALEPGQGVDVSPQCKDDSCVQGLLESRRGIEFSPTGQHPTTGLILFPGASIDVRAYAPAARAIAREGFLVILVPVPDRFALNGVERAGDSISAHPEIQRWAVGGHSMGGAAASHYLRTHPDQAQALVLWASYPGDNDAIGSALVYSISGTSDGLVTPAKVESHRASLPADAVYVALNGANHAQFGWYGPQDNDLEAGISRETQQQLVVGATVHMLRRLGSGTSGAIDPVFARAESQLVPLCLTAQRIVAGSSADRLPDMAVVLQPWTDGIGFGRAKPDAGMNAGTPQLTIHAYAAQGANAKWLTEPPVITGEVWCKLKSADALMSAYGWTPTAMPGTCADANRAVLEAALALLSPEQRAQWTASGRSVRFDADVSTASGPEWYGERSVEAVSQGPVLGVRSPALVVPVTANVSDGARGVYYCKLWSPSRALEWVLFGNAAQN